MIQQELLLEKLLQLKNRVKQAKPLIHCITNPISINDCANVVLALGGKPIMAEHPEEVVEITAVSKALALNLGNITSVRMTSMLRAGKKAKEDKKPIVIDLVGVGCSTLRKNYALEVIQTCQPQVIKGNMSELKAMSENMSHAVGIDVGQLDRVTDQNLEQSVLFLKGLAKKFQAIIVATGEMDIVCNADEAYVVTNGCEKLALLTGTGCMLNVMIGTYISSGLLIESALLAVLLMGIAGEEAKDAKGNGSFRVELLDALCTIQDLEKAQLRVL